jgi:glyoxylase-like metal-dependent hydrolase (beta-lactamase superfamily II)
MADFVVLVIGRFTRNKFWGELETQAYRDVLATSTLIRGKKNIVIDPSLPPEQMAKVLYDRSGLRPDAVDAVFMTHHHGDHHVGLELFFNAPWYMGAVDLEELKNTQNGRDLELSKRIQPAGPDLFEDVELVPLPGHTMGVTGLLFESYCGKVLVCGDSVMCREFFEHDEGYFYSVDLKLSSESIKKARSLADYIVPGHDNYFPVKKL